MWRSAVLTEIPSADATCLVLQSAGEHADHLQLALGEARRALEPWRPLPRRLDPRGHRVGVEPSGLSLCGELLRGLLRRERAAVGPRLGHRAIGVRRGQQARRQRQLRAGRATVVAGAVERRVDFAGARSTWG
jgi:hypothetical protein